VMTGFSREKGLNEEKLFGEIFHSGETGSGAERTRSTPESLEERRGTEFVKHDDRKIPQPPPGKPRTGRESVSSRLPDGRWNTYNGQMPNARYNELQQRILPGGEGGARFIPPDEYKEFLQLGHGGVFDLDLDNIDVAPWRRRGAELNSYFNYGFTERSWRLYIKEIRRARMELHLRNSIEIGFTENNSTVDTDLPPEVRRALGGWEYEGQSRSTSLPPVGSSHEVLGVKNTEYLLQPSENFHNESQVNTQQLYEGTRPAQVKMNSQQQSMEAKLAGGEMTLEELREEAQNIQSEYRALVASSTLSSAKNYELQSKMLEIKKRIAQYQA